MNPNSPIYHRRSIRLKDYDYSQPGGYFITLVTFNRECIFGEIQSDIVVLSNLGRMVSAIWQALPTHFRLSLGEFVVMPNHLHGIIILEDDGKLHDRPAIKIPEDLSSPSNHQNGTESGSLSAVIQNFKSVTTRRANGIGSTSGKPLWQRNYFEHVIRNEKEWDAIHRYILTNAAGMCKSDLPMLAMPL